MTLQNQMWFLHGQGFTCVPHILSHVGVQKSRLVADHGYLLSGTELSIYEVTQVNTTSALVSAIARLACGYTCT